MTALELAVLIGALVASYALGAVTAHRTAIRAWQRHELAHRRAWPPLPRPVPPPPSPPPFPPNREIVEGEPICAFCGSGRASHHNAEARREHKFVKARRA